VNGRQRDEGRAELGVVPRRKHEGLDDFEDVHELKNEFWFLAFPVPKFRRKRGNGRRGVADLVIIVMYKVSLGT